MHVHRCFMQSGSLQCWSKILWNTFPCPDVHVVCTTPSVPWLNIGKSNVNPSLQWRKRSETTYSNSQMLSLNAKTCHLWLQINEQPCCQVSNRKLANHQNLMRGVRGPFHDEKPYSASRNKMHK